MPARDTYHDAVRNALVKDGWTITHDPLAVKWGERNLFIDLAAERVLAAEKAGKRIAVETKCFLGESPMADLEQALGQFLLYEAVLERVEPDRVMVLAVPKDAARIFEEPIGQLVLETQSVRYFVFDLQREEILQWTN